MTTIPSASPTTMSPGLTTTPPQAIGKFSSPGPDEALAIGEIARAKRGRPTAWVSSMSRVPPSMITPAIPRAATVVLRLPPQRLRLIVPRPSITITSPGWATIIALRTISESPVGAFTVIAVPTQRGIGEYIGWISRMAPVLFIASARSGGDASELLDQLARWPLDRQPNPVAYLTHAYSLYCGS